MRNTTQFQTTPGFGNFNQNTGTATQSLWGETTGYGYSLGGISAYGMGDSQSNLSSHPLLQAVENILGFTTPATNQGIVSTVFQGQALLQSLFSENGLVLGPINGGANSFLGNGLETGQLGAISRFINLVQGVASAQAVANTGIAGGLNTLGNGTNQGYGSVLGAGTPQGFGATTSQDFGAALLTSLIHVRYYDTNSAIVIECAIVGGNTKNLNVNVVGEELRIQRVESTPTGRNVVNAAAFANMSTHFYSLPLPNSADPKGITAIAKDGILTITLPKTQEISKNVRQITVK